MSDVKHVKVSVPGERFWAIVRDDLGPDIVQIDNVLVSDEYCFKDVVKIDSNYQVCALVERTLSQVHLRYEKPTHLNVFKMTWDEWVKELKAAGIFLEGGVLGYCIAAYPKEWTVLEALQRIRDVVPELRAFE